MAIFCDKCGYQNRDTARFCKGCGGEVLATTASGILQAGIMLDRRYEIVRMIKSGGMGAVYEALDNRFDRTPCAVKEMLSQTSDPEQQQYMIDSFKKEAKILNSLRHPNLPVVRDYFIEGGRYYLVMDFIDGKDLDTMMRSYGTEGVPEYTVIEWSLEILEALEYLHTQNPPIVYRDLKPGNVMQRNSDKKIILIDFGIARTITPGSDTIKTTIGTPAFSPEEIFQGRPEPRSDIYSLGATMHCLLTGVVPVTPFAFKPVRHIKPAVSVELEAIVMCALAMNAGDRYSSARHLKDALKILSSGKFISPPVQIQPPTVPYQNPPPLSPSVNNMMPQTLPGMGQLPPTQVQSQRGIEQLPPTQVQALPGSGQLPPTQVQIQQGMGHLPPTQMHIPQGSGRLSPLQIEGPAGATSSSVAPGTIAVHSVSQTSQKSQMDQSRITSPLPKKKGFNMAVPVISIITLLCMAGIYMNFFFYNAAYYIKLAEKEFKDTNYANAKKFYNSALKKENNNVTALTGLAESFSKTQDIDSAIDYYCRAVKIDGDNKKALVSLVDLYMEKKNYKEAKEMLDRLYNLGEKKEDKYLTLAKKFLSEKDRKNGAHCFEQILKINDKNEEAIRFLSNYYMEDKDYTKAIEYNEKLLAIDALNKEGTINLGNAFYKKDSPDYKKANEYFQKALTLKLSADEKKIVSLNISDCYQKTGKFFLDKKMYKDAKDNFQKSLDLKKDNKDAKKGLAACYLKDGKSLFLKKEYESSRSNFNKILALGVGGQEEKDAKEYIAKIDEATAPPPVSTGGNGRQYEQPYYETPSYPPSGQNPGGGSDDYETTNI